MPSPYPFEFTEEDVHTALIRLRGQRKTTLDEAEAWMGELDLPEAYRQAAHAARDPRVHPLEAGIEALAEQLEGLGAQDRSHETFVAERSAAGLEEALPTARPVPRPRI